MAVTYLTNIDLAGNQLLNVVAQVLSTAPSSPAEGRVYYDSTMKAFRCFNGTDWISIPATAVNAATLNSQLPSHYLGRANHTGTQEAATISDLATVVKAYKLGDFAAPTAALDLNSQRLTGLADPTNAQDAATRAYVLAQVTALINAAPSALDTLKELATALGNDANFATSVTTAIGNARTDWGYAANVAAGTTSVDVVHSLGSRDVVVQVSTIATPYAVVMTDVELKDTTTVTLKFATAPSANQYRVLVRRVA